MTIKTAYEEKIKQKNGIIAAFAKNISGNHETK